MPTKILIKKSIIRNLKILSDKKLRTDIGVYLKWPRSLYLVLRRSYADSPEGQKWPMNQLEIRFGTTSRAEIFTRSVSFQDHSSLKISAQKYHSKWEIISEGGGLNQNTKMNYINDSVQTSFSVLIKDLLSMIQLQVKKKFWRYI